MLHHRYAVYIMANARPTLYIGMTNDLVRRVWEHRSEVNTTSFTARYHLHYLVYFELCETALSAIVREKQIKDMSRAEKLELIHSMNPEVKDLWEEVRDTW